MTSSRTEPGGHPESLTLELKVAGSPESEIELLKRQVAALQEQVAQLMNRQPTVIYQPVYPATYPAAPPPQWMQTVTATQGFPPPIMTNVCSGASGMPVQMSLNTAGSAAPAPQLYAVPQ